MVRYGNCGHDHQAELCSASCDRQHLSMSHNAGRQLLPCAVVMVHCCCKMDCLLVLVYSEAMWLVTLHAHNVVHSLASCQGFEDCAIVGPQFKDKAYMYAQRATADLHMVACHAQLLFHAMSRPLPGHAFGSRVAACQGLVDL